LNEAVTEPPAITADNREVTPSAPRAPAPDSTLSEQVAWAEEAYAAGHQAAAERVLSDVATTATDDAVAATAHSDLAVMAAGAGDAARARRHGRAALRRNGASVPALEVLAHVATQVNDTVQAAHWLCRATELAPDDAALWTARGRIAFERALWNEAVESFGRAGALGPLSREDADRLARAQAKNEDRTSTAPLSPPGRLLVCVDYFFPSIGGTELLAEGIGVALQRIGWDVEIACRPLPNRTEPTRRGMRIHEISGQPHETLSALVQDRRHDAVLSFSDPYAWPIPSVLTLPADGPRVVVVPCIIPRNDADLRARLADWETWRGLLARADVVCQSSNGGLDARLNRDLGVPGVYVPNATEQHRSTAGIHERFELAPDRPLLVCVSNLWPHKGHLELLSALRDHRGDWQLLIIGGRGLGANALHADLVADLAARDSRVTLAGSQPPEVVHGVLDVADVFLLPSRDEATPLTLLEAMSHGVPWLATAGSSAIEWSGGAILEVEDFPIALDTLLEDSATARGLGAAGRRHWEACFTYDVVARRYDALLRGAEDLPALAPPPDAVGFTASFRGAMFDRLVATADAARSPAGR
jgi:glycosyltransferase involved in cell wall biosynthesis